MPGGQSVQSCLTLWDPMDCSALGFPVHHQFPKTVQFSCSVVSKAFQAHEPQHARPPCPTPTPRVHPNPCPLSRWCHPSNTNSQSPPKPMSIESVMPSNHLILYRPLLLLPLIFPSIRVFSHKSAVCIRWPKYWSFSFNITPSNEHPGLISCRMDWLDLLAVQGTLKSLLFTQILFSM